MNERSPDIFNGVRALIVVGYGRKDEKDLKDRKNHQDEKCEAIG